MNVRDPLQDLPRSPVRFVDLVASTSREDGVGETRDNAHIAGVVRNLSNYSVFIGVGHRR